MGRMCFGLETIAAIRGAVGNDFPIFYRLGAEEKDAPGGVKPGDAVAFAVKLEKVGADVIDVSVNSFSGVHPLPDDPVGTYAPLAAAVKEQVKIPVAAVGRINTPEIAEAILGEGKADLVNIGRQLIADPYWVDKVAKGRSGDIVPCLSCMHCHGVVYHKLQPVECAVNPAAGREYEFQVLPAQKPRKVLVVGGGPAGMEAAIIAARRGHQVTLIEKSDRLGGQLLYATFPPYKEVIGRFNQYLISQVNQAGVSIKLGAEVTPKSVAEANPDVVVVATGAKPIIPDIPGVQGENVLTALDVLDGSPVKGSPIVIGGGLVGCDTAQFLAAKGKRVKILEMLDRIGNDIDDEIVRWRLLRNLLNSGVDIVTKAKVREITNRGVKAEHNGETKLFVADTVVLAVGMCPNQELSRELAGKIQTLHSIGDCVEPRKIAGAIQDGAQIACEL